MRAPERSGSHENDANFNVGGKREHDSTFSCWSTLKVVRALYSWQSIIFSLTVFQSSSNYIQLIFRDL